jgi:hypothetical protein
VVEIAYLLNERLQNVKTGGERLILGLIYNTKSKSHTLIFLFLTVPLSKQNLKLDDRIMTRVKIQIFSRKREIFEASDYVKQRTPYD